MTQLLMVNVAARGCYTSVCVYVLYRFNVDVVSVSQTSRAPRQVSRGDQVHTAGKGAAGIVSENSPQSPLLTLHAVTICPSYSIHTGA